MPSMSERNTPDASKRARRPVLRTAVPAKTTDPSQHSTADSRPTKRRRAALACLSCRRRKVRCNVFEQLPCTNCRFDHIQCSVSPAQDYLRFETCGGNTGAFSRLGEHDHMQSELPREAPSSMRPALDHQPAIPEDASDSEAGPDDLFDTAFAALQPWSTIDDVAPIMKSLHTLPEIQADQASILGCVDVFDDYNGASPTSSGVTTPEDVLPSGLAVSCLVRPLLSRIPLEDALFLGLKGALDVPEGQFCNALLEAFINYVYPFLPIIDLPEFLLLMQQHQEEAASGESFSNQKVPSGSLLLVQAVMFSASAFVDINYLRKAGFQSRIAARKAFFERTKLLYTFDCESDTLAVSQALLLMTFWHITVDDEKGAPHWISLAMDMAQLADTRETRPSKQQLWKRIKWACLIRDGSVSLGMRTPLRIDPASFKTPPLTMEDFDIITSPEVTDLPFAQNTILSDAVAQCELANMFISVCQVWAQIGRVLSTEYEVQSQRSPQESTDASRMLIGPKTIRDLEAIDKLDQELMEYQQFLPEVWSNSNPAETLPPHDPRSVVRFYQVLLNLIYQAAIATLHRPNSNMRADIDSPSMECSIALSKLRVSDACRSISCMTADLHRLRLDKFLPSGALTVLIPTVLTLALEWQSTTSEKAREETMRRVCHCRIVLEGLRETYCGGVYGVRFLQAALGRDFSELEHQANKYFEDRRGPTEKQATSFQELEVEDDNMLNILDFNKQGGGLDDAAMWEMFSQLPCA